MDTQTGSLERERALLDALGSAFAHLARRERTEAEIRSRLLGAGHSEAVVDAALGELREQRYLDDEGYARRFAEDRRRLDGWGAERIERRLGELGIPADLAARAAAAAPGSELEAALEVLRSRHPVPPADDRGRARALNLLLRRGYASEVAYEAVRRLGDPD